MPQHIFKMTKNILKSCTPETVLLWDSFQWQFDGVPLAPLHNFADDVITVRIGCFGRFWRRDGPIFCHIVRYR